MLSAEPIAGRASKSTRWRRFLHGRHAPALTHGSLILLTVALFVLLIRLPFWMAFLPCAIIQHRMGILLHEYIHGIPFGRYRTNLRVLSFFDGVMLMFGLTELFRGTHLAHHRWLNTERDPAVDAARRNAPAGWRKVTALEGVQHLIYLVDALRGRHRYVIPSRIGSGMGLSLTWVGFWILVGEHGMPLKLAALTIYNTLIPISFRGAVEHHSHPGDPAFANEYRVVIPLFGLNKHIHHHLAPRCPWYLLEYRTERPLWTFHYFTHWFHAYVARDYVLMRPVPDPRALHRRPRARGIDGPPGQQPVA
jgi:fatty acid desaturase